MCIRDRYLIKQVVKILAIGCISGVGISLGKQVKDPGRGGCVYLLVGELFERL